jgi:hypothetical protein
MIETRIEWIITEIIKKKKGRGNKNIEQAILNIEVANLQNSLFDIQYSTPVPILSPKKTRLFLHIGIGRHSR